jgi:hypothetical protein
MNLNILNTFIYKKEQKMGNKTKRILAGLSILLLLCVSIVSYASLISSRSVQENNIKETVFSYLFEHNASAIKNNAPIYFLAFAQNIDPDNNFMKRFSEHKPTVKKRSQGNIVVDGKYPSAIIDKETGELGLIFQVNSIKWKWLSNSKVEVEGRYYEGCLSAASYTFVVIRKSNQWFVIKTIMNWIS